MVRPDAAPEIDVELRDRFWAPRRAQLVDTTLPAIWDRMEDQGVVDNFRRLARAVDTPRRGMHFSDSDLFKWIEAAALAGGADHLDEAIGLVEAVQAPDGYVGTYYGHPGFPDRYSDLTFGHEHYCTGHLVEAAVSHATTTGSDRLLAVSRRAADHLLATFGPGRDERCDAHPEVELALCRLAVATGTDRYVDHAAWALERQLADAGTSIDGHRLGGHAVRALYLTSGITEVALATGDDRWRRAAERLYDEMLEQHAYPTGAVGGRWLGESVGRPYEQPDAAAYAESCAAVAAAQLSWRIWRLTGRVDALDQLELLLFNAVPAGVGADGASWFYSQPHAVDDVAAESNPWVHDFDYGQAMLREWFPARRHGWFDVPCCPANLARAFAAVPTQVAEVAGVDLLVHLPVDCRITGGGWDVEVEGGYPDAGRVRVLVHAAPEGGGQVLVRRPGCDGDAAHRRPDDDGTVHLPVEPRWWTTGHRVEGGRTVHLRRGPVVCCAEGVDNAGIDLRDLVVDPARSPGDAFSVRSSGHRLHRPLGDSADGAGTPTAVELVPYAAHANRGLTTMRLRFPVR